MDEQTVLARLVDARRRRGMSRGALAELIGWPATNLRAVEEARASLTVDKLLALAGALGVTVLDLMTEPGADAPEAVVTVTRHYCERCLGKRGSMETLVSTDLAALDGVLGLNRGLAEQARVLAAAMDECPDPTKLSALSRELRMVMDTLTARVTPRSSDSGKKDKPGGGGADFADLGVPVLSQ